VRVRFLLIVVVIIISIIIKHCYFKSRCNRYCPVLHLIHIRLEADIAAGTCIGSLYLYGWTMGTLITHDRKIKHCVKIHNESKRNVSFSEAQMVY